MGIVQVFCLEGELWGSGGKIHIGSQRFHLQKVISRRGNHADTASTLPSSTPRLLAWSCKWGEEEEELILFLITRATLCGACADHGLLAVLLRGQEDPNLFLEEETAGPCLVSALPFSFSVVLTFFIIVCWEGALRI